MTRTRLAISFAAVGLLMSACATQPTPYGSSYGGGYGGGYGNGCSVQNATIGSTGLGALGAGVGLLVGGPEAALAGGLIGAGTGALGGSQVPC